MHEVVRIGKHRGIGSREQLGEQLLGKRLPISTTIARLCHDHSHRSHLSRCTIAQQNGHARYAIVQLAAGLSAMIEA